MTNQVPPTGQPTGFSVFGLTLVEDLTSENPPPPPTHQSTISSASGSHRLLPPPPLDKDLAIPPASQPTTSSLASEARLSRTSSILHQTSQAFWWTASLPGRAIKATLDKGTTIAVNFLIKAVAQKGVSLAAPPAPETPLKNLKDCLLELRQKINLNISIDNSLREKAIAALTVFLKDHKKYLTDCYHPAALYFPEALNVQQLVDFQALLNALKKNQPLDKDKEGSFLNSLCKFLENCCQYQNNTHQKKLAEQMVRKVTPNTSPPTAPIAEIPVNPLTRKKRARVPPPIEKPVPPNNVPPIIETFDQLKSLGFRIALALLFLPKDIIQKKIDQSENLAALIKKSNTALGPKSPNEIFQDLIYTEIDNSNLNYFQKKWRKTICWLLAPSVLFLFEHFLDQSQDVVLYLIGLTPERRLDLFVKMCIEPGHGFIGWLQSKYKTISETENPGATVGQAIGSAIDHIKLKDRHGKDLTSKDLISRLVSSLFDRFAPSLNWSKTGAAHFEQRGQDSKSPFFSLWFISLSYVSRAINILTTPWRWGLNRITQNILKGIAVSQIHNIISDKDGTSLDFGKLALNSIYKALHDKLQKINRSTKAEETEDSRRANALHQRGFVEKSVQDSINKLVSDFFLELLNIQGSNVHTLQAKLSPANLLEQGKKEVMEMAYARGIQKATEEIIHGLQIFLEDHTFSAALLEVLQDIHKQWLCFNTGETETNLASLEKDFYVELKDAVTNGIQTVITNKSDPLKHVQKEANLFIDGLDVDAQTFRTCFDSLQNLTLTSLKVLKQKRDRYLIDNFRRRCEEAIKETNHSTQLQITYTSGQFEALSEPICTKINELVDLANKKKQIDDLNEDLGQLLPPLENAITPQLPNSATARYGQLQKILQKIRTKTYPEPVQLLISKLQDNFEVWRTEAQKRDNQTLINGTITTLKRAIETVIGENTKKTKKLSIEIDKKAQSAVKLTDALVSWTRELNYFDCKSDKVEIDPFSPVINYFGKETLPKLILRKIDNFVLFLGKNHHIKGILSFVIKAYLELPRRPPKEFKKIVDEVRQRPSSS